MTDIRIPDPNDDRRLRHVKVEGHRLITWDTNESATTGQYLMGYAFFAKAEDTTPLFIGEDMGCPPSDEIYSDNALVGLLAFLTLKPGDTDSDYFENYTEDQKAWAQSSECEHLSILVHNHEDTGEYHEHMKFEDLET